MLSVEEERQHGLSHGAFSYLVKPATTDELESAFDRLKTLRRAAHEAPAGHRGQRPRAREHRRAARPRRHRDRRRRRPAPRRSTRLRERAFDCCVVDLRLPDMSGFELLEQLQAEPALRDIPIVVFTGKELAGEEEARLRTVAKSIVLKDVQSPERLLDETALFLHRVIADLPEEQAAHDRAPARLDRGAARPQGARRRRRRAQHLRADDRPREPGDGGRQRHQRTAGDRAHQGHARSQRRADGHHDAGDGRLRDDARDPQGRRSSARCRSSR